jgi:Mor family transcriptional regulator
MPTQRTTAAERALTHDQRREIVNARRDGSTITTLADRYHVPEDVIRNILRPAIP